MRVRIAEMMWSDKAVPPWLLMIFREHVGGIQIMRVLSFARPSVILASLISSGLPCVP
jgi:hypothetical protein